LTDKFVNHLHPSRTDGFPQGTLVSSDFLSHEDYTKTSVQPRMICMNGITWLGIVVK